MQFASARSCPVSNQGFSDADGSHEPKNIVPLVAPIAALEADFSDGFAECWAAAKNYAAII